MITPERVYELEMSARAAASESAGQLARTAAQMADGEIYIMPDMTLEEAALYERKYRARLVQQFGLSYIAEAKRLAMMRGDIRADKEREQK